MWDGSITVPRRRAGITTRDGPCGRRLALRDPGVTVSQSKRFGASRYNSRLRRVNATRTVRIHASPSQCPSHNRTIRPRWDKASGRCRSPPHRQPGEWFDGVPTTSHRRHTARVSGGCAFSAQPLRSPMTQCAMRGRQAATVTATVTAPRSWRPRAARAAGRCAFVRTYVATCGALRASNPIAVRAAVRRRSPMAVLAGYPSLRPSLLFRYRSRILTGGSHPANDPEAQCRHAASDSWVTIRFRRSI
jgi:hypothetical protein